MKVYLSGPMTGIPEFNFPEFDDAQRWLEAEGYEVVSPAAHDREVVWEAFLEGRTQFAYPKDIPGYDVGDVGKYAAEAGLVYDLLVWDFQQIVQCDGIVMLPGWERSSGGRAERVVAESTGKAVLMLNRIEYQSEGGTSCDWTISSDIEPKRLMQHLAEYGSRAGLTELFERVVSQEERRIVAENEALLWANPRPSSGEVRVIDPSTGGAKGAKAQAMHLIPGDALLAISEHLNKGAQKYAERNWEKGYAWSLSFAAMQRHLWAWWQGENDDPEFAWSHLRAVGFHALVLLAFELRGAGTDDRPSANLTDRWEASDER